MLWFTRLTTSCHKRILSVARERRLIAGDSQASAGKGTTADENQDTKNDSTRATNDSITN